MAYVNPLADEPATDREDIELVTRIQAGSRDALERLLERHQPWIYNIGSSRNRVGESEDPKGLPAAVGAGAMGVAGSREPGILRECLEGDVGFSSITRTASRDFGRTPRCRDSSVTAMRGSWSFIGAQKNRVRVWSPVSEVLRPEAQAGAGSLVRGLPSVPGHRDTAHRMCSVRHGETGVTVVPRGQPLLHEALRLLRGPSLSGLDDQGHRRGTASRLAHGQGAREAVHAGAAETGGKAGPEGDRHR